MVIFVDGIEIHPVPVCVKIKLTEPADTPVTSPELVMVALAISLEDQVPPVAGSIFVLPPIQMPDGPERDIEGLGFTVIGVVGNEGQPPDALVNVKVTCPWEIPMTIPPLFTEATDGLLLTQTPPE